MAYKYKIVFLDSPNQYLVPHGLVDNNAKIIWEKDKNGLNGKMRLDGTFILNYSKNEYLWDKLMAMTHCDRCVLYVFDKLGNQLVGSLFTKRDISYNLDKCQLSIKPKYYDIHNIDVELEKDYNIIDAELETHDVTYSGKYTFEYVTYRKDDVNICEPANDTCYDNDLTRATPEHMVYNGDIVSNKIQQNGWTLFHQTDTYSMTLGDTKLWDIETTWFREIRLIPKAIDPDNNTVIPIGQSIYEFTFIGTVKIGDIDYNKYVRNVYQTTFENDMLGTPISQITKATWTILSYYGSPNNTSTTRTITRARRLIDVLNHFKTALGCTGFLSNFFKNNVNPISGKDLSNLMIAQKSDCIFINGVETTDPATKGIITFNQLMEQLYAMFQVTWAIKDGVLYVEHINFFKNNFSYEGNMVGLDLTTYYPLCLEYRNDYSYDNDIPVREKFSFMESWNVDFIGNDIDYSDCIKDGSTNNVDANMITTDIDPSYLDSEASKDGFIIFQCIDKGTVYLNGHLIHDYHVIDEVGQISNTSSPNAHLSWANLHHYYHVYNRPLPDGKINNKQTTFLAPFRRIKKQVPLEFPFCVENFVDIVNHQVKTNMGVGEIVKAEYTFKTGNVKLELAYE